MWEALTAYIQTYHWKGLPLRLVDGNCKAQTNWKLLSGDDPGVITLLHGEVDPVQNMPLVCKLPREDGCFYTEAVKTDNDHMCAIAQSDLRMHISQQHYRSSNLKFKSRRRQSSRIQAGQEFHRQFMHTWIIIDICSVHRIKSTGLSRKLCKNLSVVFSCCVIMCTEDHSISEIFQVFWCLLQVL